MTDDISYQRPGDLLILQLLVTSSAALLLLSKKQSFKLALFLTLLPYSYIYCCSSGILSLLFWSNKGALAAGGVAFVYMVCSFTALSGRSNQRINLTSLLFSGLTARLIVGIIVAIIGISLGAIYAIDYFGIDYTLLRVFENEDEIRSVTSRSDIFKQNFRKHFSYSPIFGHTQVEKIFGDHGEYVHSTLSILPHLGIVGFIIFACLIIGMYFEITRGNAEHRDDVLSNNAIFGLFRLSLFSFILAMGVYSAFFTWMPLWLSIGFFGTWFSFKSDEKRIQRKKKKATPQTYSYNLASWGAYGAPPTTFPLLY